MHASFWLCGHICWLNLSGKFSIYKFIRHRHIVLYKLWVCCSYTFLMTVLQFCVNKLAISWIKTHLCIDWLYSLYSNYQVAELDNEIWMPSVLWRCWLGSRKGIQPVQKTEWWGVGMVIYLEWGADLHMAQLMPLPLTVSCFSKIHTGFYLSGTRWPGCSVPVL